MGQAPTRRLVLASASPRRLTLLRQIGIEPDVAAGTAIDEAPLPSEKPGETALRLAEQKAELVASQHSGCFVLGADTVVACGRRPLGKASDEASARLWLSLLSGRRHRVHTGVAVIDPAGRRRSRLVTTAVSVKRLSVAEIDLYVSSGEWRGKAGAYGIQGRFAAFVRAINGSYSNVVGLPLYETAALLQGLGFTLVAAEGAGDQGYSAGA